MADDHQLIIIRRHEEEEHAHHSSAWKVAHADFMTAMMAFFLIMWLINVTDDEVKKSIANYFNPVKLSESVTDRKGLNNPQDITPQGPKKPGDQKTTLTHPKPEGPDAKKPDKKASADGADAPAAKEIEKSDAAMTAEQVAFSDPFAELAKLAAEVPPSGPKGDVPVADSGVPGAAGGDVNRDPFDPVYWQMRQGEQVKTTTPGAEKKAAGIPASGEPDATAARSGPEKPSPTMAPVGLASSPMQPSGADKTNIAVHAETELHAAQVAQDLKSALSERLGSAQAPHVEVKATSEGILISLTDAEDFSMFEIGSAIPKPVVVVAMEKVGDVLAERPGSIVIRGYTDGRPFHSDNYDNWRLSTARAHMAQYMLTRDGKVLEGRIFRIEGFADRDLKNPQDPNAAENRRIEILLQETAS